MSKNEVRLIDANAMRNDWLENGQNEYVYDTNTVLDSIDNQPTIDPESLRSHGRWKLFSNIKKENGYERYCSVCSHRQVGMTLFCPSCGAIMDGDDH